MHAFVLQPIPFAGREFSPGIVEITDAEFVALGQRGAIRPATAEEIAAHHAAAPPEDLPGVEAAAARPDTEQAVARRAVRPRREPARA